MNLIFKVGYLMLWRRLEYINACCLRRDWKVEAVSQTKDAKAYGCLEHDLRLKCSELCVT